MDIPWVEKYRPTRLGDLIGNSQAIEEMRNWAKKWEQGIREKPLILVGKPGCGKSSAALALAREMGWGVIELNASDVRNESQIKRIALMGAINETFTDDGEYISTKHGGRKLIIFDEADNLYEGKDDRGGKKAIVETIKVAKQPIILIGNDYYGILSGTWGKKLKSMCKVIKFRALTPAQMTAVLARICKAEGIKCDKKVLHIIAKKASGDLRAAINDLQALAQGKKVLTMDDLEAVGGRDSRDEIYKAILVTLKSTHYEHAHEILKNVDETPDYLMLWLEENMPYEYKKHEDLVKAYEYLSRADVFLGRVYRRQQYSLWRSAVDLMAAVSIAKEKKYSNRRPYVFPSWLKQMSISKSKRDIRDSLGAKIGKIYHASSKRILEDVLPDFRVIYDNNMDLRALYTHILHLSSNEIAYLTDKKPEHVLKEAEKIKNKIEKGEGGSS
ncbi:MAG: replication factor C large subunit [Euryarchaeota archaeon]|nr:replication factor C large subunit [Euryarchaeota archaeon]